LEGTSEGLLLKAAAAYGTGINKLLHIRESICDSTIMNYRGTVCIESFTLDTGDSITGHKSMGQFFHSHFAHRASCF